jgi:hypothetical protein
MENAKGLIDKMIKEAGMFYELALNGQKMERKHLGQLLWMEIKYRLLIEKHSKEP